MLGGSLASPNLYSWRPQAPTAFMIDALWITSTLMPRALALSCRSECVVALQDLRHQPAASQLLCHSHGYCWNAVDERHPFIVQCQRMLLTQTDRQPPEKQRHLCLRQPRFCLPPARSALVIMDACERLYISAVAS